MLGEALQVIFTTAFAEGTAPRLRLSGLGFLSWFLKNPSGPKYVVLMPVVQTALFKFLGEVLTFSDSQLHSQPHSREVVDLKVRSYICIGLLAEQAPVLFQSDASLLRTLFERLPTQDPSVQTSLKDAIADIGRVFRNHQRRSHISLQHPKSASS
jgi:hypothetical protein